MSVDADLADLARRQGIFDAFEDMQGVVHHTSLETQRALLAADGVCVERRGDIRDALAEAKAQADAPWSEDLVVTAHVAQHLPVGGVLEWEVIAEAGDAVLAAGRAEGEVILPPLPDGVHLLNVKTATQEQSVTLISAPAQAPSLKDVSGQSRCWGVMAALYGLRADEPQHLGNYRDLAELARICGRSGAAFVGVNPVHALGTAAQDSFSPYSPTHRGFLNTDHIAVPSGASALTPTELIDYKAHRAVQRPELQAAFDAFCQRSSVSEQEAFSVFRRNGGDPLEHFGRFEALSEVFGADSRRWPDTADKHVVDAERVSFHIWLQWQADQQVSEARSAADGAGMGVGLYLDLAVGPRLGGAESWGPNAATAPGVSLGAPPDHLSPAGQNWQLAALSPRRLRAGRYDAFRFVLRQNMRRCGLLRIDHALGLNRSFWLPEDGTPGGYIRQPFKALMGIIAIEAARAGCAVVGEDLGLVPDGFRDALAAGGLYGYSVMQYEKDAKGRFRPANAMRRQSLACFATHDTPTLEGFWQGRDITWWEKLGWIDAREAARATDRRTDEKRQLTGVAAPQPLPQHGGQGLRDTLHARLAESSAALVAVQLDDILGLDEAQNMPGTVDEHPNWRRRYAQSLSQIETGPDLRNTAKIMARAGRTKRRREDAK